MSQSDAVLRCSLNYCVDSIHWCVWYFFPLLKSSPVFKLGWIRHCDRAVCNHFSQRLASTFNTRITCDITLFLQGLQSARRGRGCGAWINGTDGELRKLEDPILPGKTRLYQLWAETCHRSPSYFLCQWSVGLVNSFSHASDAMTKIGWRSQRNNQLQNIKTQL